MNNNKTIKCFFMLIWRHYYCSHYYYCFVCAYVTLMGQLISPATFFCIFFCRNCKITKNYRSVLSACFITYWLLLLPIYNNSNTIYLYCKTRYHSSETVPIITNNITFSIFIPFYITLDTYTYITFTNWLNHKNAFYCMNKSHYKLGLQFYTAFNNCF